MLLRLAYLGVSNAFALLRLLRLLRLLPVSDREKDAEILALRHQLSILQRQLGPDRVRFTPSDRALLALLHRLPRRVLTSLHLMVRLVGLVFTNRVISSGFRLRGWQHGGMLISFAYRVTCKILGAVATLERRDVSSAAEVLVLRDENTVLRRHVKKVCYRPQDRLWFAALSASTVWGILHDAGIDPAPRRSGPTWRQFLTTQAPGILAIDFVHVDTVLLKRIYALIMIEHGSRRVSPARDQREPRRRLDHTGCP